jgi:hypothetical protein
MSWRFSRARRLPEDKDVSPFFFHLEFGCLSEAAGLQPPKGRKNSSWLDSNGAIHAKQDGSDGRQKGSDAQQNHSDAERNGSDAEQNDPDGRRNDPDAEQTLGDGRQNESDAERNDPDGRQYGSAVEVNLPDGRRNDSDTEQNSPDAELNDPDAELKGSDGRQNRLATMKIRRKARFRKVARCQPSGSVHCDEARNEGHRKQPQGAEDEEWAYMGKHE